MDILLDNDFTIEPIEIDTEAILEDIAKGIDEIIEITKNIDIGAILNE